MSYRRTCPSQNPRPASVGAQPVARRFAFGGAALALAAALPMPALAASGETNDTWGAYSASADSCGALRDRTGVSAGAITFACDANRSTTDGRKPCDILSLGGAFVRGSALGF